MVLPSHYLPIITLHANNTNSTIKRYDWPIYRLLTNNTPHKDAHKVKEWKNIWHANRKERSAESPECPTKYTSLDEIC